MKHENLKKLVALALPALALSSLALAREAPASETATAAAPEPAAAPESASASAAASAPGAETNLSIADWSPPEVESDKPKPEEWAGATKLSLLRPHKLCSASAVREWLRISCMDLNDDFRGVRVLGGSEKDVSIVDDKVKAPKREWESGPPQRDFNLVHVIFPVRKSDRRVLGIINFEGCGWKCFYNFEDTEHVISELWLPNEPKPTIVLH